MTSMIPQLEFFLINREAWQFSRTLALVMMAQPAVRRRCCLLLLAWALLAWALLAGLGASGGVEALGQPWCGLVDTALVGWNTSSYGTATHKLCHLACLETPGCQSANYWYRDKLCQLNSVAHWNVSGRNLVEKAGSVYTFSQQDSGCSLYSKTSCHDNGPKSSCPDDIQDPDWRLVFKGVAGTGVSLFDMWTTMDWNSSYEASCHRRNNSLYQAWHKGQLDVKRVKLSLYDSSGVVAELIFDGNGSDLKSWFTQARLSSSPWGDLKSATFGGHVGSGQLFSIDGDVRGQNLDRRFVVNKRYGACLADEGWLVVTDSDAPEDCAWEEAAEGHSYPIIFYSPVSQAIQWAQVGASRRADILTIHVDADSE